MQVARLLEPRSGRSFVAKLRQIVRAVEIERALSKDQMLALYLDLAPYGGNIEGVRAASLAYFGKEPRHLSLGEAALLVALPQSPEARRPDRFAAAARVGARPRARPLCRDRACAGRRDRACQGRAGADGAARDADAGAARCRSGRRAGADRAAKSRSPSTPSCRRTWKSWRANARARSPRRSGPIFRSPSLAADNATGEVLARVGSPDYFDRAPRRRG